MSTPDATPEGYQGSFDELSGFDVVGSSPDQEEPDGESSLGTVDSAFGEGEKKLLIIAPESGPKIGIRAHLITKVDAEARRVEVNMSREDFAEAPPFQQGQGFEQDQGEAVEEIPAVVITTGPFDSIDPRRGAGGSQ